MEREYIDLKRLTNEEDEAIAVALADTLCQDNVEKFLQLYDEIPAIVSPKRVRYNYLYPHFPWGPRRLGRIYLPDYI